MRLAYATSGTGPPLVKAANWMSHLDLDWGSPIWTPLWQELGRRHTLVRYDERGSGLSDWDVDRDSFTLDAWVRDLETVVDELGLERFPLLGLSHGGVVAITYAARHPERVSHLIVYGTCSRQTWARASDEERAELTALGQLIRTSWGGTSPGFRQVYDAKFMPDGPLEMWRAFDDLQRRSTSPQNAYRLWKAFGDLDPSDAALSLDVPTLIMHSREDQVWSYDNAEELHGLIRGSRLVPLETNNHILQAGEPAFAQFVAEVEGFSSASTRWSSSGAQRRVSRPHPKESHARSRGCTRHDNCRHHRSRTHRPGPRPGLHRPRLRRRDLELTRPRVARLGGRGARPPGRAATAADAAAAADFAVVTVPCRAYRDVPVEPLAGKIVLDTNNYYWERDGHFDALDRGEATTVGPAAGAPARPRRS